VQTSERTLIKSPPEVWKLVDDPALMERWTRAVAGPGVIGRPLEVTVREPGRSLSWRAPGHERAELSLEIVERGWGTNVRLVARAASARSWATNPAVLEQLLDELGSPQRRPFERG
jgi:uncharacterized protein YndB with AHSA1/START domain